MFFFSVCFLGLLSGNPRGKDVYIMGWAAAVLVRVVRDLIFLNSLLVSYYF